MSSDTTLVIARVGDKFRASILQAAEFLEHPKRKIRWKTAVGAFLIHYRGETFGTYENAREYGRKLEQEDLERSGFPIEYGSLEIEILLEKRDVRNVWFDPCSEPPPFETMFVWDN